MPVAMIGAATRTVQSNDFSLDAPEPRRGGHFYMSNSTSRARWAIPEPRGSFKFVAEWIRSPYVGMRMLLCTIAATILWLVCNGWAPSFPYRDRLAPLHRVQARVPFEIPDAAATAEAKGVARSSALCYYRHNPTLLENLRMAIRDRVFEIAGREFSPDQLSVWAEFYPSAADQQPAEEPTKESFERFRTALAKDQKLDALKRALERTFADIERFGLLESLQHEFGQGDMQRIIVVRNSVVDASEVDVSAVRIPLVRDQLRRKLQEELARESEFISDSEWVAQRILDWFSPKLPTTLSWDRLLTRRQTDAAIGKMPPITKRFQVGDPLETFDEGIAEPKSGASHRPLSRAEIDLLRAEHDAYVRHLPTSAKILHSFAFFGMMAAVLSLLCAYLHYRDRKLLDDLRQFATLLGLMIVTISLEWLLATNEESRAELIPVAMLAMLIAIAFDTELSIMMAGLASLVFAIGHGYGLGEFVLLAATATTFSLLCRSIRSRSRLIYVGFAAACVAGPTTIGANYMLGQPVTTSLFWEAIWFSAAAMVAALFMTALLPFLEQWFEIQTDIRLLELADANHLLLRELVQRAPGTYNHSISVASIAEAAADVVGANGLLCRVGAYFHDIGKMRKPEYFVENQIGGASKHEELVPTMSTLVIIAHVKDGAEMARQHHLPQRVIDIIEQHHGTTLVEYFYNQAAFRAGEDSEPEESSFRYPGPKPQSREAAIVMLADAAESASRALRDPGPARLESLVESIVLKRVTAGQLDDCSLTMSQLRDVKTSLIKSLNAMYHARIKYPEAPQPA
jgi:putative nucleotidyltransferase with HDIG domain